MSEVTVTFNRNVKLGSNLYRKGDTIDISEGKLESIIALDIIDSNFERITKVPEYPKPIKNMTVNELKKYAKDNKVDLGEAKQKGEILEVIKAFIEGK